MQRRGLTIHKPAASRIAIGIVLPLLLPSALIFEFLQGENMQSIMAFVARRGEVAVLITWIGILILSPLMFVFWTIPTIKIWKRGFVFTEDQKGVLTTQTRRLNLNDINKFEHITFPRKQLKIWLKDGSTATIETFLLTLENTELERELRTSVGLQ